MPLGGLITSPKKRFRCDSQSERNRQRTSGLHVALAATTFGQYFGPKRRRGSSIAMRVLGLQQSSCLGWLFVRAWSFRLGRGGGSITLTLPARGRLLRSSRSLQGNAVPPQPVVHRPDIASELRRDVSGTSVLLEVQVLKAPLGED